VVTAALNRPQPTVAPAADPMVMVRGMVDILKEIKPAPDTSATDLARQVVAQAEAANTRIYQLQADQMTAIRQELKEAKAPTTAAVVATPTRRQMLEDAVEEQRLLKTLGRGGSAAEEEEKPSKIEKYAEILPMLAPTVGQIISGFFQTIQAGFQSWQHVAYNNALAKNGGTPQPPAMNPNTPAEPGKPIPPQAPTPTAEQQAQTQRIIMMLTALESAAEPISNAIDDGDSGAVFAESVIKWKRRPAYDMIRALGEKTPGVYDFEHFKNNLGLLMQHPNRGPATAKLWEKVAPLPTFGQFLKDFFDYDEILHRAEEEQQQ
jgi:hypothetical protein